ncbi:hypothetical protein EDD11_008975 [Mortierella claussenii]|nr:hypothetical protein EDD11_008975 [Mortierella claussenii]
MTTSPTASTPVVKKSRRFSLVRLFNNSNNNNGVHHSGSRSGSISSTYSASSSTSSSSTSSPCPSPSNYSHHHYHHYHQYQRHSMEPMMEESGSSMQTEMMCERRKSIATMTENPFRTKSFDFRPSAIRPSLSSGGKKGKETVEMTEKMRQFDELLETRRSSTIRITLTPSLLQEP